MSSAKALLLGPVWTSIKATLAAAAAKLPFLASLFKYFVAALKSLVSSPLFMTLLKIVWALVMAGLGDGLEPYIAAIKRGLGWMIW